MVQEAGDTRGRGRQTGKVGYKELLMRRQSAHPVARKVRRSSREQNKSGEQGVLTPLSSTERGTHQHSKKINKRGTLTFFQVSSEGIGRAMNPGGAVEPDAETDMEAGRGEVLWAALSGSEDPREYGSRLACVASCMACRPEVPIEVSFVVSSLSCVISHGGRVVRG